MLLSQAGSQPLEPFYASDYFPQLYQFARQLIQAGKAYVCDLSEEEIRKGRIPLQTFVADIDFAVERAYMPYGVIGIKVWIYKGNTYQNKSASRRNAA